MREFADNSVSLPTIALPPPLFISHRGKMLVTHGYFFNAAQNWVSTSDPPSRMSAPAVNNKGSVKSTASLHILVTGAYTCARKHTCARAHTNKHTYTHKHALTHACICTDLESKTLPGNGAVRMLTHSLVLSLLLAFV